VLSSRYRNSCSYLQAQKPAKCKRNTIHKRNILYTPQLPSHDGSSCTGLTQQYVGHYLAYHWSQKMTTCHPTNAFKYSSVVSIVWLHQNNDVIQNIAFVYFSLIRHNRTIAHASVLWHDINLWNDWLIDWRWATTSTWCTR